MAKGISLVIAVSFVLLFQGGQVEAQREALRNVETLILKDAYTQAAKECEKVLVHHRQASIRARAHYLLGICLLKEARYDEARKNLRTVLGRYRRSEVCDDACLSLADSYFLAGDFQQAGREYGQFLRDFPRSELADIARKHKKMCEQGRDFANSYFSVQTGCFANKKNAGKLRGELIDSGYRAYILELPGDGLYRVRVGRFNDRLQAELLGERLKAEGFCTKICP